MDDPSASLAVADSDELLSKGARIPQMRRRWFLVVGVLAGLIGVAALWWLLWMPHYRPGLQTGEVYGVDVSNHQGAIDWEAVADDEISFAYVKATEGGDFVDVWFGRNWDGARAEGLNIGAYHFFTLCTPGAAQAANFLGQLPIAEMTLPPALDLEFAGNCSDRPSQEWVHNEVRAFVELVEEKASEPILLYVSTKFDNAYQILEAFDRRTWHRSILRRPGDDDWVVWQLSYSADVDGIQGGVDLNIMRPG